MMGRETDEQGKPPCDLPNGWPEFGWRQFQATPINLEAADRIEELEAAIIHLASGRKPCASGTQRISRDEMKSIAREYCVRFGLSWQQ